LAIRWRFVSGQGTHLPPAAAQSHIDRPDAPVLQYQLVPAAYLAEPRQIAAVAAVVVVAVVVKASATVVDESDGVAERR